MTLGCGGRPATIRTLDQDSQLDVELTTDLDVPKDVDSIRVETTGAFVHESVFELGPAGLQLPGIVFSEGIVFAADQVGSPPDQKIDVTIVAWKGSAPFTVTHAVAMIPFVPGRHVLRMSLSSLCSGTAREVAPGAVASTCPAGQSCRGGACRSDDRTAETMPAWTPSTKPACFDVAACVASGAGIAVDLATCSAVRGDATNFAVVGAVGGEGFCTSASCVVPLQHDVVEGWSEAGGTVVFPAAVCDAITAGRATSIVASNACATWSPDQPFCVTP